MSPCETSLVTQHFHVLVLFAGAFYLGIAILCLCISINRFSVRRVGHFPVFSFCFCSVNFIHLIWWACIWSLRLPFRKRATCNLLLVFVFTLSLCFFLHLHFLFWFCELERWLAFKVSGCLLGKLSPYHILHCICSCICMCPYICVWTCICPCICICICSFCDGGSACIAIRVSGYLLGNLGSAMIKR